MTKKQLLQSIDCMFTDIINHKYQNSMTGIQKLSPTELIYLKRNLIHRLGLKKGNSPVVNT